VVDLVQVVDGQAATDAAIADGVPGDKAQYLGVDVRNQHPRLRTLPLAGGAVHRVQEFVASNAC
jgi:hypothetical protein